MIKAHIILEIEGNILNILCLHRLNVEISAKIWYRELDLEGKIICLISNIASLKSFGFGFALI